MDDTDVNEPNPADNSPISDAQGDTTSSPDAGAADADASSAAPDAASAQSTDAAEADIDREESDRRAYCQRLFEFVRSCASPVIRSERWAFLGNDNDLLRIELTPSELIEALNQDYPIDLMFDMGLLDRVDGELRLPSSLENDAQLYVRINDEKLTLCFSTDNKFLFPMRRTALDFALERLSPNSSQATGTLYVVESHDAADVIEKLGMRATVCDGLEAIGRHDVPRLFDGDPSSDLSWRYHMLFMDFDLATLENRPAAAIGEVINRLADLAEMYRVDLGRRFGVCRPSEHEFQVLERAIRFEDSAKVRELLEKWSVAAKSAPIKSWRTQTDTGPISFSAATAALTRALQLPADLRVAEVVVALPAYLAAGKEMVIGKFFQASDRASDPFDQVDLIAAADYAREFFELDPFVRAAEAVLAGDAPPTADELQEDFERRQRCLLELRRIRRDRKARR